MKPVGKFGYMVKVTPIVSKVLQELAYKNGFWRGDLSNQHKTPSSLDVCGLFIEGKRLAFSSNMNTDNYTELSVSEAIELFCTPDIIIGGNIVEFLPDGDIKVGCQTIAWNRLEQIYKKASETR